MNRDRIRWTISYAEDVVTLAPQAALFAALARSNPDMARYPSSAPGDGSRSTDATSSVERAAMNPDPIQQRLTSMADDIALAASALKRVADAARWLANPDKPAERANSVPICVACNGPSLPRAKSHAGEGPFCENDYRAWARIKAANPDCTLKQWLSIRDKHHAA